MQLITLYALFSLLCLVYSKNINTKSLTESLGQEVIEIAGPKELPTGIEEEPSAEGEDEDVKSTSFKKEFKRITPLAANKKPLKDFEKIDGTTADDEEVRLEKELAEIYKDPEYKDSSEVTNAVTDATKAKAVGRATDVKKPIGRSGGGFKFAPDTTDREEIDRFRTSYDDINCNDKYKLKYQSQPPTTTTATKTPEPNAATKINVFINLIFNVILVQFICI